MKKRLLPILLSAALLTACGQAPALLEPVASEEISQEFSQALRDQWDAWNRLSRQTQMLSSRTPGYCRRDFDSWAEWEVFLGLEVPNPLEDAAWLEQGTCVGMPLGFRDAPRVSACWCGTEDGYVERVSAYAGYRDGEVRVQLCAVLFGDPEGHAPSPMGEAFEEERQAYLAELEDGPAEIVSDSSERYYANRTVLAQGRVLYRLDAIGESDAREQVEDAMGRALAAFSPEGDAASGA